MLSTRYLLDHIDALIRLSHEVQDRAASAKLREMADELRIVLSVADVTDLVATLHKNVIPAASALFGTHAVAPESARKSCPELQVPSQSGKQKRTVKRCALPRCLGTPLTSLEAARIAELVHREHEGMTVPHPV